MSVLASEELSLASLPDVVPGPAAEASTDASSVSVAAEVAGADRRDADTKKSTLLEKEVLRLRRALASSQRQARELEARLVEVAFSPQVQEGVSGPQRNESPSRNSSPAIELWDGEVEPHVDVPSGSGRRPRHIPLGARSVSFPAPASSPSRTLARTPSTPVRTSSRTNLSEATGHRRRGSESKRQGTLEPFPLDEHLARSGTADPDSGRTHGSSAVPSTEASSLTSAAPKPLAPNDLLPSAAGHDVLADTQTKLCFDAEKVASTEAVCRELSEAVVSADEVAIPHIAEGLSL